jgi:hypothetical protein
MRLPHSLFRSRQWEKREGRFHDFVPLTFSFEVNCIIESSFDEMLDSIAVEIEGAQRFAKDGARAINIDG